MRNINIFMVILSILLWSSMSVFASFFVARSSQELSNIIASHNLVIVHFNPQESKADQDKFAQMKSAFIQLSQKPKYQNAMVAFVGVNTAKFPEIGKEFNAPRDSGSKFVLFQNGVAIQQSGNLFTKDEIKNFIDKYFGKIIDETIEQNSSVQYIEQPKYKTRTYYRPARRVVRYSQPAYYDDYDDYDYYYPRRGYYPGYYYGPGFGIGIGSPIGGVGFGFGW